jgi:hypothetical protein
LEFEKLRNPLRNETLMLAFVSGILAWVITLALKAALRAYDANKLRGYAVKK